MVQPKTRRLVTEAVFEPAIESKLDIGRGDLPDGSDFDEVFGAPWAGFWRVPTGATYVNGPFDITVSGVVEVLSPGVQNAVVQRVTMGTKTAFREIQTVSGGIATWNEWSVQDAGQAINRVSFDPAVYLEEGEIAAVIDERHSGLDFGYMRDDLHFFDGEEGVGAWGIYPAANAFEEGGAITNAVSHRAMAIWDRHGMFSDGEALARISVSQIRPASQGGVILRAQPGMFQEGYYACIYESGGAPFLRICRYTTDVVTVLGSEEIELGPNEPYFIRFRAEGDILSAKLWLVGDPEPDPWTVQATDTAFTHGWPGVGKLAGISTNRWGTLVVNSAGGRA